jgi:hypothetical protein
LELQLFDSEGGLRFRVHDDEPLWRVLGGRPGPIDDDAAEALAASLEDEVRRLRAELPEVTPESYAMANVDVLGERLRVPARDERYHPLRRANDLLQEVRGALDAGLSLRAVARPELTPEQFRVAWVLKDADAPVPKHALPALLEHRLDELRASTTDGGVATALERERAGWADPQTPDRVVTALEAVGLVREGADGTVRATEDLRLLRI